MFVLELTVCVSCLLGFVFLFFNSLNMPRPQTFWDSPGAFPVVLSTILVGICVFWLMDLLRTQKKAKAQSTESVKNPSSGEKSATDKEKKKKEQRSFIIISVLTILYIMVLMPLMPFPLATFVFLTLSFLLFAKGKWWKLVLISASLSVAIYIIFTYVLHLPMPR